MAYNLTMIGNQTGLLGLAQSVNTNLMFGYFGFGLLISIGVVLFTSFYWSGQDAGKAAVATLFITWVLGIFMTGLGLISLQLLSLLMISSAIITAIVWKTT